MIKEKVRQEQKSTIHPLGRYSIAPKKDWREIHPLTRITSIPWNLGGRSGDIIPKSFAYGLWVAGMSSHYGKRIDRFALSIGATMTERQRNSAISISMTGQTIVLDGGHFTSVRTLLSTITPME